MMNIFMSGLDSGSLSVSHKNTAAFDVLIDIVSDFMPFLSKMIVFDVYAAKKLIYTFKRYPWHAICITPTAWNRSNGLKMLRYIAHEIRKNPRCGIWLVTDSFVFIVINLKITT